LFEKLLNNPEFIEKYKWKDGKPWKPWKDGEDGKPWKPWKDGKDGEDGIDWQDWWNVVFIDDLSNLNLKPNQLWIDINKNLYIYHNNTILSL